MRARALALLLVGLASCRETVTPNLGGELTLVTRHAFEGSEAVIAGPAGLIASILQISAGDSALTSGS